MDESSLPSTSAAAMPVTAAPTSLSGRGRGRALKNHSATVSTEDLDTPQTGDTEAVSSNNLNECRRSSRKKIIKFDVRDLLNKNRKQHKIQIEARIDSNAPIGNVAASPSQAQSPLSPGNAAAQSVAPSSISSSPVDNPRILISGNSMLALSKGDIFAKPKTTPSLIVAQVNSEPLTTGSVSGSDAANVPSPLRKRGRPRKVQPPAVPKTAQIASTSDAAPTPLAIFNYSDSDTNSTSGTASTAGSISGDNDMGLDLPKKSKSKFRVALKRLNMANRQLSMYSSGISVGDALSSSSSEDTMSTPPLPIQPQPDFNLSTSPTRPVVLPVTEDGNVQENEQSDSDSQIIFVEIENEKPDPTTNSNERNNEQKEKSEEVIVEEQSDRKFKILFPKQHQQQDELQEQEQEQVQDQEQEQEQEQELIVEVLCEPPSLWSADDEADEYDDDEDVTPRRSKRSIPRPGIDIQPKAKTLEETFAEITSKCTKQMVNQEDKEKHTENLESEMEVVEVQDVSHTQMEYINGEECRLESESMVVKDVIMESPPSETLTPSSEEINNAVIPVQLDQTLPTALKQTEIPTELASVQLPMETTDPSPEPVMPRNIETLIIRSEDSRESLQSNKALPLDTTEKNVSVERAEGESPDILDKCLPNESTSPKSSAIASAGDPDPISIEGTQKPLTVTEEVEKPPTAVQEESHITVEELSSVDQNAHSGVDKSPSSAEENNEMEKLSLEISPPPTKEEQRKIGETTNSCDKSKDKSSSALGMVGFVECDAMFKALDRVNAQIRHEEKSKKKLKVEARKSGGKIDSSKGRSSPGVKKIEKETEVKEEAELQPVSVSITASASVSASVSASASSSDSKNEKNVSICERRNTISSGIGEMTEADGSLISLLTKRRYSLHPKASPSPDLLVNTSQKKKQKKKTAKPSQQQSNPRSRQISVDSSSSASPSGIVSNKRKMKKSIEAALQAALTETESSESTSSGSRMRNWKGLQTPSTASGSPEQLEAPDPLKDIAKFIEDGVNLLKRDYKLEEEEQQQQQQQQQQEQQQQQQQQQQQDADEDEFAERVNNMETPAATPSPQPINLEDPSITITQQQQQPEQSGVRRSHRIKQKPQGNRSSQGRSGSTAFSSAVMPSINMEDQLSELAHIEAINEQFLRSEGLNTFTPLKENYYRCARQVSQENAEMQCDCFLTGDEEAQGHLCCGAGCINRMLMIECGPLCTNGDRCTNKRFQQHQCWPCRVFRTEKKGCGITAELQIPPGEFIMEYVGEVIDAEEFERRQHLYSKDRNRHYYFMALRGEAIIDATSKGNISRYINHSCDPNAETQKWTVNGELRIGFFSVKTILPGEEITFDYQYQRYGRDAQRCFCEAINCRGWIGGEPDSDEGEQVDEQSESDAEDEEEQQDSQEQEPKAAIANKAIIKGKNKIKTGKTPGKGKAKTKDQQLMPKPKDKEYKAGRWLRPSGGVASGINKSSRKPKVNKFHAMLEDPDVLEELTLLSRSGLKNQLDTLRFSRCMVRAKLIATRLQLLGVLTRGELPCRRLFLDYHGLRLLHAWISESGSDDQLRLSLLDVLEVLPIPNRTMLNDSRVYQSVQLWVTNLEQDDPQQQPELAEEKSALRERILALLKKWSALPEIFRIPKRERIEQMKEHEREADRHVANTALEERISNNDRFRQDRFRRDTVNTRKPPTRMSGNNTICTITTQPKGSNGNGNVGGTGGSGGNPGSTGSEAQQLARGGGGGSNTVDPRRRSDQQQEVYHHPSKRFMTNISKETRRWLFERRVALDEAEKRVSSEDWREHETRCEYFNLDLNILPKMVPFYQNTETGEWFNNEDMPVPAPPRAIELLADQNVELPATEKYDVEYKLPPGVDPLPPAWHWRLTPDNGDIYYYNLRERISQWEPPSAEQRLQQLVPDELSQASTAAAQEEPLQDLVDPEVLATELINIDVDYVGGLSVKSLAQYIEGKIRERRELRRSRLESIRVISPRRDEDRLYNQLESRKYKENKEKIRRRKEIYRRRRLELQQQQQQQQQQQTTPPNGETPESSSSSSNATVNDSLTIQGYLYSSDEEATVEDVELPLIDGIVAGQTQVDELDALNIEPSTSKSALAALTKSDPSDQSAASGTEASLISKRKLPMPPNLMEQKKHRLERSKKSSKSFVSSSSSGREATEKFRFAISGHVADFLRPYRKDSCQLGRITSDEDYRFLIKRLSHHITTKEMRYCDMTGNPLACTESVKHKSYDFVNQYMRKKGCVYRKPADEPCF